ncbi:LRR receptor-like serine threonine-protein kinase [Seminavis robusta]|uniref:LRR receptor-like serine threonine-protein kinase n=1 Tax=Seminavis robusta TaxID=568900 RepID=A0A9N8DUR5_9STRA|nr:LRR receptor-like serine threonine-protein kinase [Seminavis robusta]|eukprot:Sro306_g113060.1 LRR receptor-like serine threonine-protein kinase (805) ;mRNA; f:50525-53239
MKVGVFEDLGEKRVCHFTRDTTARGAQQLDRAFSALKNQGIDNVQHCSEKRHSEQSREEEVAMKRGNNGKDGTGIDSEEEEVDSKPAALDMESLAAATTRSSEVQREDRTLENHQENFVPDDEKKAQKASSAPFGEGVPAAKAGIGNTGGTPAAVAKGASLSEKKPKDQEPGASPIMASTAAKVATGATSDQTASPSLPPPDAVVAADEKTRESTNVATVWDAQESILVDASQSVAMNETVEHEDLSNNTITINTSSQPGAFRVPGRSSIQSSESSPPDSSMVSSEELVQAIRDSADIESNDGLIEADPVERDSVLFRQLPRAEMVTRRPLEQPRPKRDQQYIRVLGFLFFALACLILGIFLGQVLQHQRECLWFSSAYGRFSEDGRDYQEEIQNDIDPCNHQGRIQTIILDDLELSAFQPSIPPEIALLSSLSYFVLRRNGIDATLRGWVPPEIYKMQNLTYLGLNHNEMLTGQIPSELAMLTSLQEVQLDSCSLSGSLPTEFGLLQNARKFEVNRNRAIKGTIPTEFGMMTSIHEMSLNQNKLSGSLPSELFQMTEIKELQLARNKFTGTLPVELGLLTRLADLRAQKNKLFGTVPSELGLLTRLTRLNFGYNNLEGEIPSEIGRLTAITQLYLSASSLSGPIPSECGLLTNVTSLVVFDNNLSFITSELWQLANINHLRINGNQFNGQVPTDVGQMKAMVEPKAFENSFTGALPSELALLTGMTTLELHGNQFSGSIPSELSLLALNGALNFLTLGGNALSGVVPDGLCALGQYNTSRKDAHGLQFDCDALLCGCDWCSCS